MTRAGQLSLVGAWIGLFDWLMYAALFKKRVLMLIGSNIIDIVKLLGGADFGLPANAPVCRVIAAWFEGGVSYAVVRGNSGAPRVNHYLVGTPLQGSAVKAIPGECSHHEVNVVSGGSSLSAKASMSTSRVLACHAAACKGWHMHLTQAAGDCGIDCMCFFENIERTQQSYRSVRSRLCDFIKKHAGEKWVQAAFAKCGEDQPLHAVSMNKSGQVCPRVAAVETNHVDDSPAKKQVASLELALDADATAVVRMESDAVPLGSSAIEMRSRIMEMIQSCGGTSDLKNDFEQWIVSLPAAVLDMVSNSFSAYAVAKQIWSELEVKEAGRWCRKGRSPKWVRKRVVSTVVSRLQAVQAFKAWREAKLNASGLCLV